MLVDVVGESNYKKIDVDFCTENARKDAYVKARLWGPSLVTNNL